MRSVCWCYSMTPGTEWCACGSRGFWCGLVCRDPAIRGLISLHYGFSRDFFALVAQLVEQGPLKSEVDGSSPSGRMNRSELVMEWWWRARGGKRPRGIRDWARP